MEYKAFLMEEKGFAIINISTIGPPGPQVCWEVQSLRSTKQQK